MFLAVAKDQEGSAMAGSGEGAVPALGAGEGLGEPHVLPGSSPLPARAGLIALEAADC